MGGERELYNVCRILDSQNEKVLEIFQLKFSDANRRIGQKKKKRLKKRREEEGGRRKKVTSPK